MTESKKRILIIDDNPEIHNLMSCLLSSMDCRIYNLSDGQFGLDVFNNEKIDLVICDMLMPLCDGIEVIQKIKLADPHAKVIGISGGGLINDYLPLAKGFGANSILYKPFTQKELFDSIYETGFTFLEKEFIYE